MQTQEYPAQGSPQIAIRSSTLSITPNDTDRWKTLREFLSGWQAWLGISILIGVVLIAMFAPLLAPYDPETIDILNRLKPPSLLLWVPPGYG